MIIIKSSQELRKMRVSGRLTAELLSLLEGMIEPGMKTGDLDARAEEFLRVRGARSAFKGYHGYPSNICVSVNDEIVHGIPGDRLLEAGDIVSLDVGIEFDGYYGDMARTFTVGEVNGKRATLIRAAREALDDATALAREGCRLFDISHAIESRALRDGFSVVRDYVGHGIGANLHEDPQIPNCGTPHTGPSLRAGMVLAIEAMLNLGGCAVNVLQDGWTAVTRDGKASAHFENTVEITENGPEVLTCQKRKRQ